MGADLEGAHVRVRSTVATVCVAAVLAATAACASPAAGPTPGATAQEQTSTTGAGGPDGIVLLSSVTEDPRLPSAQALPAGLLAGTDDSWLVALVIGSDPAGDPEPVRVHDLVAPDGTRYQLPSVAGLALLQWQPGSPYALALAGTAESADVLVLDLETGQPVGGLDWPALSALAPGATSLDVTFVGDGSRDLLATVDGASGPTVLRVSSDGAVLATSDGTWANPRPSPRGDRLLGVEQRSGAVVEVDPLSLAVTGRPLGGACWPRWVDAATWAATCAGDGTRTALVDASGGVTTMELAVAGSTVPLLLGDDGLLVAVRQWVDGELLADRVVRASPGGATDLSTGLGFVWDARGPALVGVPALPTLGVSQPVLALTAPVVAWQAGEGRATTLVPPGETGVTTVIPVHGPGDGIGGSLVVTETGGLEFRPPD